MKPNLLSLPLSSILVEDRQRLDLGDIDSLAESLRINGQIQPILVDNKNRLVAGGRRLAAATKLGWTHIHAVQRDTMTEDQLFILELEENVQRKDMDWQEKCLNIAKIHSIKSREKALDLESWGQRETGAMLNESAANINFNLKIAKKLQAELGPDNKPIEGARFWKCSSLADALKLEMRDKEDALRAELLKRQQSNIVSFEEETVDMGEFDSDSPATAPAPIEGEKEAAHTQYLKNPLNPPDKFEEYWQSRLATKQASKTIKLSNRFFNLDSIQFMLDCPNRFDHIITDIPYGIDMEHLNQNNQHGGMKNIDIVEDLHDVQYNEDLFSRFFKAAFHCTKDHSFVITWCDQAQWQRMYDLAVEAGFAVQRWPIVWHKTYQAMNNCIAYNFTKDIEIAMVCRKKGATITAQPQTCVISTGRDELCSSLGHPFAKPFAVWEFLAKAVALPGQTILDPFAGRGSGPISFLQMGYNAFGVELDKDHYAALLENVKNLHYLKLDPTLTFV